jgi:phospholipid-binding lipoprotein MlaA
MPTRAMAAVVHLVLSVALLGGCASTGGGRPAPGDRVEPTVVGYPEARDPLMPINRAIFAFNDLAWRYALFPLNRGYRRVVPQPVRTGIANFFSNLRTPISLVNHLLQGQPEPAARDLLRFGINTTFGLFGLFDPASVLKLERQETTFEDTLTRYGAGQGVFLMLPLLGPADTRNGAGRVVDYFLHPLHYIADERAETALRAADAFQQFPPVSEQYETIREKADDPSLFFRNLYWQGVRRDVDY